MAMARALFDEGLRFLDAGQWADAADRFSRMIEIRYSAVAAYNLGLSQARLGRLVVAGETLRKLLAVPALETTVRDSSTELLADVQRRQATLTVEIVEDPARDTVRVDGQPWPKQALGVAVPVDPGAHELELVRGARVVQSTHIELAEGERHTAQLGTPPAPTPAQVALRAPVSESVSTSAAPAGGLEEPARQADEPAAGGSLWKNPWLWVGAGAVVVAITTVVIVAATSGTTTAKATPVQGDFMPALIAGRVKP